jgi:hypothetical protein
MSVQEINQLMSKLEELKRQSDRADGAIAQLETTLKREFGVDSLEEATKLLKQEKGLLLDLDKEIRHLMGEWKDKWGAYYDL